MCQYCCFIWTGERARGLTYIPDAQVRDLTNAITGLLNCQGENGLNPWLLIITMQSCLRTVNEFLINYSFLISLNSFFYPPENAGHSSCVLAMEMVGILAYSCWILWVFCSFSLYSLQYKQHEYAVNAHAPLH